MTRKRLPVLIERSVGQVDALRREEAEGFERKVLAEKKVTCTPGCASCCYHPISISILEGLLIYRWLVEHQKWTSELRDRLQKTAGFFGLSYEVWLLSLIPCPLLDGDKKCSAYDARPLICRAYFADSDPYYCHPHRLGEYTSIIPREKVVDAFHEKQEAILRRHKLQLLTMSISDALLFAERVEQGQVDLDTVDALMLKRFAEKG